MRISPHVPLPPIPPEGEEPLQGTPLKGRRTPQDLHSYPGLSFPQVPSSTHPTVTFKSIALTIVTFFKRKSEKVEEVTPTARSREFNSDDPRKPNQENTDEKGASSLMKRKK